MKSDVVYEKETGAPLLRGTGDGSGNPRVDAITVKGVLLSTRPDYVTAALMLDITVTTPCGPGPLDKATEKRQHGVDVAVGG